MQFKVRHTHLVRTKRGYAITQVRNIRVWLYYQYAAPLGTCSAHTASGDQGYKYDIQKNRNLNKPDSHMAWFCRPFENEEVVFYVTATTKTSSLSPARGQRKYSIAYISKTASRMHLGPSSFDSVPQTLRDMIFSFFWVNFPFKIKEKRVESCRSPEYFL